MNRSNALGALSSLALAFGVAGKTLADTSSPAPAAADIAGVVGREVVAYNAHDAAGVTKLHAPDATLMLLPAGNVLAKGSDQLVAFFTKNFSDDPAAHLTLEKQFVLKNVVINHYSAAGGRPDILSIYEVANGVIANEWVILG